MPDSDLSVISLIQERAGIIAQQHALESKRWKPWSDKQLAREQEIDTQLNPWIHKYLYFVTKEMETVLKKMKGFYSHDKDRRSILENKITYLKTLFPNPQEMSAQELQSHIDPQALEDGTKMVGITLEDAIEYAERNPKLQTCFNDFPADLLLLVEKATIVDSDQTSLNGDFHLVLFGCGGWEFDKHLENGQGLYKILDWQKQAQPLPR